jgi:hypothetical protein
MGTIALRNGIMAFRNPERFDSLDSVQYLPSSEAPAIARIFGFTREKQRTNRGVERALSVVIGPFFIALGAWMFLSQVQCPNIAREFLSAANLQAKFWFPIIPFTALAVLLDIASAAGVRMRTIPAVAGALLAGICAFCAGEGAAYHVGDMSNRWMVASLVPLVLMLTVNGLGYRYAKKDRAS